MSAMPHEGWLGSHLPPQRVMLFPAPSVTGYTVEDWLKLPQTGERIELIDGSYVVTGVPAPDHALCASRLVRIFDDAAPDDLEVVEAVGVEVGEDGLIPDVVIADAERFHEGTSPVKSAEVAAVIEVVSPGAGNRRRDYDIKPPKYAAAGIPVFIRVELQGDDAPRVEVFHLGAAGYELAAEAKAGETLRISEPYPVSFDPAVLAGPRRR